MKLRFYASEDTKLELKLNFICFSEIPIVLLMSRLIVFKVDALVGK